MVRLHKCSFCSRTVYPGFGTTFVRNDSRVFKFCTGKCHKSFKMKRNPKKVKWTKAFRKLHGKDMSSDISYDFERRRNRPVKYDRELYAQTVVAMKRIVEIQQAREARHKRVRMREIMKKRLAGAVRKQPEKYAELVANLQIGADTTQNVKMEAIHRTKGTAKGVAARQARRKHRQEMKAKLSSRGMAKMVAKSE
ncbi:ribosome biogenesis protein RLP24 [Kipferlia bialata]|uniref:Ribosome biogenesis protein RLP24 n=1 Tax=Kipferlia bialata TaxID=797122 RepID=A0A391NM19_9EUKA|nr:ribosome biogenesis protein RLP24 [Kipferlia bialata]|eukprot:g6058.t1